jgi:hypothetical protein
MGIAASPAVRAKGTHPLGIGGTATQRLATTTGGRPKGRQVAQSCPNFSCVPPAAPMCKPRVPSKDPPRLSLPPSSPCDFNEDHLGSGSDKTTPNASSTSAQRSTDVSGDDDDVHVVHRGSRARSLVNHFHQGFTNSASLPNKSYMDQQFMMGAANEIQKMNDEQSRQKAAAAVSSAASGASNSLSSGGVQFSKGPHSAGGPFSGGNQQPPAFNNNGPGSRKSRQNRCVSYSYSALSPCSM